MKIIKNEFECDDDSFEYWALSERVPRAVFSALLAGGAIFPEGDEMRTVWSVDPVKAIPIVKRMGILVENEGEVLAAIKRDKDRSEREQRVRLMADTLTITCPHGDRLSLAKTSEAGAVLRCYKHDWCAVVNAEGKVVEAGAQRDPALEAKYGYIWDYMLLYSITHPEEWAAEQAKRREAEAFEAAMKAIKAAKTREAYEAAGSPDSPVEQPKGEVLQNAKYPRNVWGGGEWYIFTDDSIWVIENNGADGDNWSANNIITAGAGAIGYKCKRTPELEAAIRAVGRR